MKQNDCTHTERVVRWIDRVKGAGHSDVTTTFKALSAAPPPPTLHHTTRYTTSIYYCRQRPASINNQLPHPNSHQYSRFIYQHKWMTNEFWKGKLFITTSFVKASVLKRKQLILLLFSKIPMLKYLAISQSICKREISYGKSVKKQF